MKRALILLVCIGLTACANIPTPETARERYAAAEASYKAVVTTIDQLAAAGTIQKGAPVAQMVASSLRTTRAALDVWGAAPDTLSQQQAALMALGALQQLLVTIQRR